MSNTQPTLDPGLGLSPATTDIDMISTNAVSKGDLVVCDGTVSSGRRFDTVDQPATADLDFGLFGVALEDVAALAIGRFRFRGLVEIQTAATPAVGAALGAANGVDTITAAAAAAKVIGFALVTGTTTPTLCMFNGIEGFGNNNA